MAVEITRGELSADELRLAGRGQRSGISPGGAGPQVLDGHSRSWAALAGVMDRQTPRHWARRHDAAISGGPYAWACS